MRNVSVFAVTVCIAGSMLTGCATRGDIRRLERDIAEVRLSADRALIEARAASADAKEAEERSRQTEEMVNRSFQRSMRK